MYIFNTDNQIHQLGLRYLNLVTIKSQNMFPIRKMLNALDAWTP